MINKIEQDKIKGYIKEARRRFGNNLNEVEIFCMGCIYADSINNERDNT